MENDLINFTLSINLSNRIFHISDIPEV